MRWKRILAGAATILLGLMLCAEAYESLADESPVDPPRPPLSIDAIRELADLTVLEITATEIVTRSIAGHTGSTTAVVVVTGSVTLAVDLEQARIVEVDEQQQHIVLALPQPTVRRVAIDHELSRVAGCQRSGLWRMAVGEAHENRVIADAFAIGQRRLEAASRDDLDQRARGHAESVLGRFVSEMGWTLDVRWQE